MIIWTNFKSLNKGDDQVIATSRNHAQRWNEVMEKSDHSVTLIDLCGTCSIYEIVYIY